MKFEDLLKELLVRNEEVCYEADQELLEDIMNLVKSGKLKPTALANPLKGKVSLYMPYGEGRIHVTLTEEKVCVHFDRYDPARSPLKHLITDTELSKAAVVLAILAFIGYLIKKLQKGRG